MSSQSSVYSEKKIAAYESLFKESNFAKPQEVYLTITVAHVFGQAYILEQEGTKEGDPVYSRFVCPLEEITKVYVNDKIKKPWPLFIQCDTNVKGVVHRKRIVIPCLSDPTAIAEQINEVKAIHMQKYEAAVERENRKKREALENARMKEQIEKEAKNTLPPLPAVEKLPDPIAEIPVPPKAEAAPIPESKPKAAAKSKTSPASDIKSVKALTSELEDSFKALESFDNTKTDIKPLPKKPIFDLDNLEEAFNAKPQFTPPPKADTVKKPAPVAEEVPEKTEHKKPILDLDSIPDAAPVTSKEEKAPEIIAEPVQEPISNEIPKPVPEPAQETEEPINEPEPAPAVLSEPEPVAVSEPEPEPVPAPKPAPVKINPNGKAAALSEFEAAVIKLKERLDNGEISSEEYASEKKKLISTLY
ncbi:MAG: SHOCT domain-containing protein [Huintestinicola sp.]